MTYYDSKLQSNSCTVGIVLWWKQLISTAWENSKQTCDLPRTNSILKLHFLVVLNEIHQLSLGMPGLGSATENRGSCRIFGSGVQSLKLVVLQIKYNKINSLLKIEGVHPYTHVFNWHHPCQRVINVKKFWNK
jgi:hypothetical protein